MNESFRERYNEAAKDFRHVVSQKAVDYIVKAYGENFKEKGVKALPESMDQYLKSLNIQPDYIIERNNSFEEQRHALNTEAGLAIANHPAGFIDVPMLLRVLNRPDFKAYVLDKVYNALVESFQTNFGEEGKLIITNKLLSNSPQQAKTNFKTALEHIKNGGLLIMHPTAGEDRHSTEHIQFQPGFRLFLKHLEPNNMVYSFCFNPQDIQDELKGPGDVALRFSGLASEQLTEGKININRERKTAVIRVDEKYSTVDEWQGYAQDDNSLTKHYWDQYKIFMGPEQS